MLPKSRLHLMRDSRHIASNNNFKVHQWKRKTTAKTQLATESTSRHHAAWVNKSINRQTRQSNPQGTDKKRFMNKKNRIILLAAMLVAAVSQTFAQGNGLAGINEATSMVTSYFDPGTKLIYAIGAVVGLIGGIKVYGKFSSGDPDTSKTAASWFGACIFLIVSATILRSFFL